MALLERLVVGSRFKARLGLRVAREPDILFVSNARRHLVRCLEMDGGPDLVVEIINSDKARSEALAKIPQYERAGAAELWLIDLPCRQVSQEVLQEGSYVPTLLKPAGRGDHAGLSPGGVASLLAGGPVPPFLPILQELLAGE